MLRSILWSQHAFFSSLGLQPSPTLAMLLVTAALAVDVEPSIADLLGPPGSDEFPELFRRALESEPGHPTFEAPAVEAHRASRFASKRDGAPSFLEVEKEPSEGYIPVATEDEDDESATTKSSIDPNAPTKTPYGHVYCRCAPLQCNCSKTCTCYVNPDGSPARPNPTDGLPKDYTGPVQPEPSYTNSNPNGAPAQRAKSSAFQTFFQPFASFVQQDETSRRRAAAGGDTCPASGGHAARASARLRGTRTRANGVREEWCVQGAKTHRDLERNIAAAADDTGTTMLELNMSYTEPSNLYYFGGDPEFKRVRTETYVCDKATCGEMDCKCAKYCRCRGVPIPLFEGETDANSKGIPVGFNEAGYWPWWPQLYDTYYYNTDPPKGDTRYPPPT